MPSLLDRGSLEIPQDASSSKQKELKSAIPKQYILDQVRNTTITNAGSKFWVIKSGTGSGKSTVLPTALFQQRARRVVVTQPQRLTAEEIPYDVCAVDPFFKMGENIGFQTGLINKAPPKGVVYMTVGVLLHHFLFWESEKLLRRYSTIIVDEVHKHDLQTDVLLRLLKIFVNKYWTNPDCPIVVVQSATLEPKKYMDYFETKNYIGVTGVSFPIAVTWPSNAVGDVVSTIAAMSSKLDGDTIIFLPGAKQIKDVRMALESANKEEIIVDVMGKDVALGLVKQLMKPSDKKRFVLATNAAETGLTLPFLKNIIDSGFVTAVQYNPQYNCKSVTVQSVSKASAMQRRGRVGRKFAGSWYPLYTEDTFNSMEPANPPDIYTNDVSGSLLILIVTITETILNDHWQPALQREFDPAMVGLIHDPSGESFIMSYEKLYQLGLITKEWRPTTTGYLVSKMQKVNLEAAKMIFSHAYFGVDIYKLIVIAAAMCIGGSLGKMDGFDVNELYDDQVQCGFIRLLLIYESLQRQIKKMDTKHLSTNWIREWCTTKGLEYETWLMVIESIYEITFQIMEMGIKVNVQTTIPLLDSLDSKSAQSEIVAIKNCIYEGHRLNSASWSDKLQSYVTNFKHNKVALTNTTINKMQPLNVVMNETMYRNMKGQLQFASGDFVSVLDDFVEMDDHYMY